MIRQVQCFGSPGKNNKKWWTGNPAYFTSLSGNEVSNSIQRYVPAANSSATAGRGEGNNEQARQAALHYCFEREMEFIGSYFGQFEQNCIFDAEPKCTLMKVIFFFGVIIGREKVMKDKDVTRPWNKFLKIKETKHFFYLFISENDAQIVQKRMFGSKEEAEQFKQFVSLVLNSDL